MQWHQKVLWMRVDLSGRARLMRITQRHSGKHVACQARKITALECECG
jgi:hypothetical protein